MIIALVGKGDLSTGLRGITTVMSILILFGIGSSISYANAETINVYVQEMPRHWQDQFGDVMSNAIQYWENKIPNLKFNTVQYIDRSDFVVEWASQYDEGKLGYYSTNTANDYNKPTMAITLGFFKDKKWHLASSEHILQITKHELGHAIGLPDSVDPNDVMYPTAKDYESLQQGSEQVQASNVSADVQGSSEQVQASNTINWYDRSEKYQKIASEKILPLASKIDEAQSLLNSASQDTNAVNDELGNAMTALGLAKEYLDDAKKMQTDADSAILQSDYFDSYNKFKLSYHLAKKVELKLAQMTEYIEKASSA